MRPHDNGSTNDGRTLCAPTHYDRTGTEKGDSFEMPWYIYILRCGDGTLYTGITDDVEKRLAAHQSGRGAKYTRGRGPLTLVHTEEVPDKSAALKREAAVKKLSRAGKLKLIGEI